MIGYVLLGMIVGGAIGYMVAYSRFGNAKLIEELRTTYTQVEQELADQGEQLEEFAVQNKILKSRAQQLLDQNEDYSKVISQLSRYYYRLQQTNEKLKELASIVSVVEEDDLGRKIDSLIRPLDTTDTSEDEKRFF